MKTDAAGIGLALVSAIVKQHRGRLGIVSEEGKGTTVFVEIPTQEGEEERPVKSEPASAKPLSVLMVEDDELVVDIVVRSLADAGHTVAVAKNGREGLEKFRTGTFDVVITDRAMPQMSGYEMANAIRKIDRAVPIVLLTGFGDMILAEGRKPDNIDVVLSKPVTMEKLEQTLKSVVATRRPAA
jgi:CheY-like chemotaxis protein